jgi:DNA polymerase-3 subunit delta
MKIVSSNILSLANKPLPKFVLIYGPEEAEINTSLKKILDLVRKQSNDEIEVVNLEFSTIKDNPIALRDEAASQSLFGNKRVIVVTNTGAAIGKDLMQSVKDAKYDTNVIFLAGDLAKSSSTRKFFEETPTLTAIACYKPDLIRIKKVIKDYFDKKHFKYQQEVIDVLASSMPANELIILNELEKLSLYMGEETHLSYDIVKNVVSDTSDISLDDLCNAIAKKDAQLLNKQINMVEQNDINFMLVIRVVANFLVKVMKVKLGMESGKSVDQSVAALMPPVYFKQKDNMLLAGRNLSLSEVRKIFDRVIELEVECKKGVLSPELALSNGLESTLSYLNQ